MMQVPGSGLKAETFKRVMRKRNNNMPACLPEQASSSPILREGVKSVTALL